MFFLGLLSTPLPYLLLAAFYFFGFAMGMFNNSSGDETVESTVSITIPVEIKQKTTDHSAFYYQAYNNPIQTQTNILKSEDQIAAFSPDTGTISYRIMNFEIHDFLSPGFHFSRPPPSIC